MEKCYRDPQKFRQSGFVVFIIDNLLHITYNTQTYDVKTGGYSAEYGICEWIDKERKTR
jgi:hypothetical protein